nr:hypothetical protein [uncultured Marinifilum sp.]
MRNIILMTTMLVLMVSCVSKNRENELIQKVTSLEKVILEKSKIVEKLNAENQKLTALNEKLKYSASDRIYNIRKFINDDELDKASNGIKELVQLFPNSKEAKLSSKEATIIEKKKKEKKAEAARVKALGFKVFTNHTSAKLEKVNFTFTKFSFGREFGFGHCSDVGEYSYETADKDNIYLLGDVKISSKEKYVTFPSFYLYKLEEGVLKHISYVNNEYASWSSYGAKIGNYSDDSHDFSKVNSVNYKIAVEIGKEESKEVLFLLAKINGDRQSTLTVNDVMENYIVVRIFNKSKI